MKREYFCVEICIVSVVENRNVFVEILMNYWGWSFFFLLRCDGWFLIFCIFNHFLLFFLKYQEKTSMIWKRKYLSTASLQLTTPLLKKMKKLQYLGSTSFSLTQLTWKWRFLNIWGHLVVKRLYNFITCFLSNFSRFSFLKYKKRQVTSMIRKKTKFCLGTRNLGLDDQDLLLKIFAIGIDILFLIKKKRSRVDFESENGFHWIKLLSHSRVFHEKNRGSEKHIYSVCCLRKSFKKKKKV